MSEARFRQALERFAGVVGDDWVFSEEEDVLPYDDAYSPYLGSPEGQRKASAAVAPNSVEQVQEIVRIANEFRCPLYTVSTGRNYGYGGASPNYTGSVIVDLKRMNKIIEVNTEDGYMIVEPGINFIELWNYFQENNIDYVLSSPGPGWGSPIGNALDHGVGTVFTDNFSAVMGLEVVLANGEVMRTGRGALPGSPLWPHYKYAFGPEITGIFSQSNFGIVTKACFILKKRWEMTQTLFLNSYIHADFDRMIQAFKDLRNQEVIGLMGFGVPIRDQVQLGPKRAKFAREVRALNRRRDGGPNKAWEELARRAKVPAVQVMGGIRGPTRLVEAKLDYLRDYLSRNDIPGELVVLPPETEFRAPTIDFGLLAITGFKHGHIIFSPIIRQRAQDLFEINLLVRNLFLDEGMEDYIDRTGWWGGAPSYERAMMLVMGFQVFDNEEDNARMRRVVGRLVEECGKRGWGEYRAPVVFHDEVAAQFSFNNNVLRRFNEAIYDALDPNGILSPGKSGIWPKHLRDGGGLW